MACPAVIARPGLVYGPGDLHLLAFFRSVLRRRFRPIGRRKVWLHPIYIDDMTEALVRCGRHAAAVGECFHLAGREPVPLADWRRRSPEPEAPACRRDTSRCPPPRAVAALGDRSRRGSDGRPR